MFTLQLPRRVIRVTVALTIVGLVAASPAGAQTITFNGNACVGNTVFPGATYIESGFQFAFAGPQPAIASAAWCSDYEAYAGSAAIFNNFNASTTTLSRVGGGTFSLSSIDLASIQFEGSSGSVQFTGNLFGGGTVTSTKSWSAAGAGASPTFSTSAFDASWTNLSSVVFEQSVHAFQFDNVVLSSSTTTVPEPSTVALMTAGLLALGVATRRNQTGTQS